MEELKDVWQKMLETHVEVYKKAYADGYAIGYKDGQIQALSEVLDNLKKESGVKK